MWMEAKNKPTQTSRFKKERKRKNVFFPYARDEQLIDCPFSAANLKWPPTRGQLQIQCTPTVRKRHWNRFHNNHKTGLGV
jgi:hypothetical protein